MWDLGHVIGGIDQVYNEALATFAAFIAGIVGDPAAGGTVVPLRTGIAA